MPEGLNELREIRKLLIRLQESTESRLQIIEILLSGVVLKREVQPEVAKLEKLIGIRKGTLSGLFPQRRGMRRGIAPASQREGHEAE